MPLNAGCGPDWPGLSQYAAWGQDSRERSPAPGSWTESGGGESLLSQGETEQIRASLLPLVGTYPIFSAPLLIPDTTSNQDLDARSPPTPGLLCHTVTMLPTPSPLSSCECFLHVTSHQPRDLVANGFPGAPLPHPLLLPSPAHVLGPDGGRLLQDSLLAFPSLDSTRVLWDARVDPFPALGPAGRHGGTGNVPSDLRPCPLPLGKASYPIFQISGTCGPSRTSH